ncbi:MAG: K(+)-transporting ATPase subunit F [Bacteroidales bacterium]|jgi:K+-transporting ATPase KdpF subunit|nr:K(+)-transporting ATPase subunit F [Bacteroidales bacterium]
MNADLLIINNGISFPDGYGIMTVIAILILGYLLYALLKPEKF